MGWMRTLLLGDIGNRLDIADTEKGLAAIRASQSKTVKSLHNRDRKIEALEQELGQQKLAVQALTRFLIENDMVDEAELDSFIELREYGTLHRKCSANWMSDSRNGSRIHDRGSRRSL